MYVSLWENLTETGEKVNFPIYEIDITQIAPMSITTQTGYQQANGTVPPCPKNCNLFWVYNSQYPDFRTIFPDWENMPHVSTAAGSVIRSDSVWANVDGVYWIADSPLQTIPVGQKPDDWDSNWMYYGVAFLGQNDGKTYRIFTPLWYLNSQPFTNLVAAWDANAQYYKNEPSDHDYRVQRVFKTDNGFNFGCSALGGNPTATYWGILNRRAGSAPYSGEGAAGNNFPYTWEYADTSGNYGYYENTGTSNSAGTVLGFMATDDIPSGGINVYHNQIFIFVHFVYQDIDYYGLCLMQMSNNTEGAYPTIVRVAAFAADFWGDSIQSGEEPDNPPDWGDDSETAGGQGTFTFESDNRNPDYFSGEDFATRISNFYSAVNNGGFNVYQMLPASVSEIVSILFGSGYLSRFENTMYNPLSAVLSYHLLPAKLLTFTEDTKHLTCGGYDVSAQMASPVSFPIANPLTRYHVGDFDFPKYFDAFPDFSPFTKITLHLPYIGVISIDTNSVAHGRLSVDYVCDAVSGNVAAWVCCKDKYGSETFRYIATGNAAYNLPLFSQTSNGSAVGKIVGGLMQGAAGIATGNAAGIVGGGMSLLSGAVDAVARDTTIRGTFGGNAGLISDTVCFIEIERPIWCNPSTYPALHGVPSELGGTIAELGCEGFTKIESIELDTIPCTDSERAEIANILFNGIQILTAESEESDDE